MCAAPIESVTQQQVDMVLWQRIWQRHGGMAERRVVLFRRRERISGSAIRPASRPAWMPLRMAFTALSRRIGRLLAHDGAQARR